jgi:hypothetical protein
MELNFSIFAYSQNIGKCLKKKKRKERKKMTMGKPGDFSAMEAYEEVVCFR